MLDEFAIQKDPVPWYEMSGLRINTGDMHEAIRVLLAKGYIARAGIIRDLWTETVYAVTKKGFRYWEKHVKGVRVRPPTAPPLPRYTKAQLAAAMSPRDVFDLARVPWTWSLTKEPRRLGPAQ